MNWENEGDAEIPDVSLLSSVKLFLIRKWKSQKILILVSFLIEDHKLSDQTIGTFNWLSLCCCCSVAKLCLILCNLVDDSTPDSSVLHCPPEFPQICVHWVGDAIQPSHPLLPPSPFAFNPSQPPGLFQWVSSSHQVVKVLELQFQHQSFQWIFRVDFL